MKNQNLQQQEQDRRNLIPFFSSVVDGRMSFEHHSFSSPNFYKYFKNETRKRN